MAFSAGCIFEGQSTGLAGGGGGFNPTSANFATDLTTDANTGNTSAPIVSSASYNFVAGDASHWLFVQGGTNWTPGWYPIVSVASNKATIDGTAGHAVLYGTSSTGVGYQRPNGLSTLTGVATVATPTGGVWSVDYSQHTAAGLSYTDMVIDGTTNTIFTSAAKPVAKNLVGNIINVTSGIGFTVQRVEVISTSGTQATVDKSLGTLSSTGGNGTMGGSISSLATLFGLAFVAGNKIYVKATATYTITTTITVTASTKGDATGGKISAEGYTTYRGQRDGRPIITTATNSIALFTINDNDFWEFIHLKGTSTAATKAVMFNTVTSPSTPFFFHDIVCDGPLAFLGGSQWSAIALNGCEITNATSAVSAIANAAGSGALSVTVQACDIHDNSCDGFRPGNTGNSTYIFEDNIFDTNTVAINFNVTSNNITAHISGNTFVDNTDGIKFSSNSSTPILGLVNNVFWNNSGEGINNDDDQATMDANMRINRNNAFDGVTGTKYTQISGGRGEITLTADPFVDKAGRNFAPNTAAGGGALLRAVRYAVDAVITASVDYGDVGAVQHQDSGGGGGPLIGPGRLLRS